MTDYSPSLDQALGMAEAGYKIVPIPTGFKYPKGFGRWQDIATDDPEIIRRWLAEKDTGIGWAMGKQPNGMNLFALDIDGSTGGDNFLSLVSEFGAVDIFKDTCQQITGSAGAHYIFQAPFEIRNSASQFAPSIDLRGEGGQIVVGPSIHPNGQPYVWRKNPIEFPPLMAPHWVRRMVMDLNAKPEPEPVNGLPISELNHTPDDETPFEWLNRTFDSRQALRRLGWTEGKQRGSQVQFTRPGKEPRHGTSATCHVDTGVVNVYSTNVSTIYHTVGKPGQGCVTLTPADLWMVENSLTDPSEASRQARALMTPPAPATGTVAAIAPVAQVQVAAAELNLPSEFWEARPWLAHIRDAAHARMASADAILGALLTRFAAAVPPNYVIPAIVMAPSTFDHMSVLVSETGGGKSGAMSIARELFPGPGYDKIVWDYPNPTGEGLVDAFFEMIEKEDGAGKKRMVNTKTKDAVHFSIDEAMALVEAGVNRKGATIGSVLCTAWSGGNPGQGNASAERKRVGMNPGTFRISGLAAIQLSLGHHLLTDSWVQQGLSGRLVFFSATDPSIPPDEEGELVHPGPLDIAIPPTTPITMTYAPEIRREVRREHWESQSGKKPQAGIDAHLRLVKLKLSGLFALIEGRTTVTTDDWELINTLVASHLAIRAAMFRARKFEQADASLRAAEARGHAEYVAENVKEKRIIDDMAQRIITRATEEGTPLGRLKSDMTAKKTAHRWGAALERALESGKVVVRDNRLFPT